MRIKRFLAPDMRTALRMVRDEQGPDAVILSNRSTPDGIEVVAATDYDESLVTQALRAAAPALETTAPAAAPARSVEPPPAQPAPTQAAASVAPIRVAAQAEQKPAATGVTAAAAAAAVAVATSEPAATAARDSLMSRARAIFRIGQEVADAGPTLAELTATPNDAPAARTMAKSIAKADARAETAPASNDDRPTAARFEAMMAALNPPTPPAPVAEPGAESISGHAPAATAPNTAGIDPAPAGDAFGTSDADYLISLGAASVAAASAGSPPRTAPSAGRCEPAAAADSDEVPAPIAPTATRRLHSVAPAAAETDPAIIAMRSELATMRQLMEKQMEQLSLERLRGSPARAAALDALLAYGCDETLAQSIAARIDPRLPPSDILAPMRAELMRNLTLSHSEPIDDGGVIALVGPTGAGKTTTAAKLAARFAARHRARDVALVSIDRERTGAREQLHAHGRRLGITVCDADNSDALGQALDQLQDYPLVLVDTAGYGVRDRALLRQILWLRSSSRVRSLLVLPANANPLDLGDIVRRYRPAAPEGVVLTKLDETGRPGASLSVLAEHGLSLAYTTSGQQVPADIEAADADRLARTLNIAAPDAPRARERNPLEELPRAADNAIVAEDRHAFA